MPTEDIAERFARDTGPHAHEEYLEPYGAAGPRRLISTNAHSMTVLHDDGPYRHLRFKSPDHGHYWFDLVTIPHALIFRGDGDSYVFSRTEDMFGFFRDSSWKGSINPTYWSEKLTSDRNSVMRYDQDEFERQVKEHVVEAIRDGSAPRGLGRAVTEMLRDGWLGDEGDARRELENFEHKGWRFIDTWEWSFRDFDWWFLWACNAIIWGIAQYDATRAATEPVLVAGGVL